VLSLQWIRKILANRGYCHFGSRALGDGCLTLVWQGQKVAGELRLAAVPKK